MSLTTLIRLATLAATCASAAFAADQVPRAAQGFATDRDNSEAMATHGANSQRAIAKRTAALQRSSVKDLIANPSRAYPPSCLANGMPFQEIYASGFTDPIVNQTVVLLGDPAVCAANPDANECTYSEQDTVSVWRTPCSDGTSATLLEIDRPTQLDGNVFLYPVFPAVSGTSGGNGFSVRVAEDPNTVNSAVVPNTPIVSSKIFVLENYPGDAFDFNQPFTLTLDNLLSGSSTEISNFNLSAYDPSQYGGGTGPLPISGYLSTSWYDPAHSGQGIVTNVYELANTDPPQRLFFYTWYTYDENPSSLPFWLVGSSTLGVGDTSITVPTAYFVGGDFAGDHEANPSSNAWGTVTFSFPTCNEMTVTYDGQTSASVNGPSGQGVINMARLGNINGLTCE